MTTADTAKEPAPQRPPVPYVSFSTLRKLIERMHNEGGVPGRVDRSYLTGMSGGYQAQILVALRIFGLIDESGIPTAQLRALAGDPEREMVPFFQQQINMLYPEMIDLGRRNGTASQLAQLFRDKYGISGSTLIGAVRFYLDASKFAEVPVGKHFKPPARAARGTAKNAPLPKSRVQSAHTSIGPTEPSSVASMANTLRVPLASGGQVVLTTAVDLIQLSPDDRTFVFGLIDKVKGYSSLSPEQIQRATGSDELKGGERDERNESLT